MELRCWRRGDETLLVQAGSELSRRSLRSRFLSGTARIPETYLRHIATAPPERWSAELAIEEERVIGWAEYGRYPHQPAEADLAILVVDAWQRRGVASALVKAMLPRCADAGVRMLRADVDPSNTAARAVLRRFFGTDLHATIADGLLHYRMSI
jgi:RimJ/RimL family protein N-acetyltransferase